MNTRTVNQIINLARQSHNARFNQGQGRLMNINNNLTVIKRLHGAAAVNKVFNLASRYIKNHRINRKVRTAAHRFKMGPRIKAARPTLNYLPPNIVQKISTLVRKH